MSKNILISGASGLVGSNLIPLLESKGYHCFKLVRHAPVNNREIEWHPGTSSIGKLPDDILAVVNLAGENIAGGRWTSKRKELIRTSRVNSTRLLIDACKSLVPHPTVFISASGIGIYGDRGDSVITEGEGAGKGFLPDLAVEWEQEALKGASIMRVVTLRIGVVLSKQGGALQRMLLPFKLGLGGRLGSGKQYMSWIHLEDLIQLILFAIENRSLNGAVNAVAPESVRNSEFTSALGAALARPSIIPVPSFILRMLMGEMADELLLASTRAVPKNALESGFKFSYPNLRDALRKEI